MKLPNFLLGWALVAAAAPVAAQAQATQALAAQALTPCDAPDFQAVLQAAAPLPANPLPQAVWLDARRLQWPQLQPEPGAHYRLVASRRAGLRLQPGQPVHGADASLTLAPDPGPLPAALQQRWRHLGAGLRLVLGEREAPRLAELLRRQLVLVQLDAAGRLLRATPVQLPGALDVLYAAAERVDGLGAHPRAGSTSFRLWAPTAQAVSVCLHDDATGPARRRLSMRRDLRTGVWSLHWPADLTGHSYRYLVEGVVPGVGRVRNRVTDPYALGLTADSQRSVVLDLAAAALKPPGWDSHAAPATVQAPTDLVIYELHVRDFSIGDTTVPAAYRGKYAAFTVPGSAGMQHLAALARAGVTDLHLLPVFDFATVPELGCTSPDAAALRAAAPDSETQQAAVMAGAATDCFNWGYDPLHYTVPEGSYASDAADASKRIVEFRQMVQALHGTGLRVGMDVVYNHTSASGQHAASVLDRIVPGYYHRLDAQGRVERSTCCDNTATEHRMMGKLLLDSVLTWARAYRIDSFRFDLMGHQPRALMLQLKQRLREATGRDIALIGEGWNFGEVADGARFEQASQLSLNGSGIATFSDRARDALRGRGGLHAQGWLNGLVYDPHPEAPADTGTAELLRAADLVRVGLAGSLRDYPLTTHAGATVPAERIAYGNQPAGYVAEPSEVVNYVENHDNRTLFDENAGKLPPGTAREDRARVQMLGAAVVAFSQGIAYFHAGQDILRSKSMDGNSFDSGDWFNQLDWTYTDNHFGSGLPPKQDNGEQWPALKPLLADASIKPGPAEIAWSRDAFRDLLAIRASSTLFRLHSAAEIRQRLHLHNTGPAQVPTVLVGQLDGEGLPGAAFREIVYLVNADKQAHVLTLPALQGRDYQLHPVHRAPGAADRRPATQARYERASGRFQVPARTAVVWVRP